LELFQSNSRGPKTEQQKHEQSATLPQQNSFLPIAVKKVCYQIRIGTENHKVKFASQCSERGCAEEKYKLGCHPRQHWGANFTL
jgi:hypothetical protein